MNSPRILIWLLILIPPAFAGEPGGPVSDRPPRSGEVVGVLDGFVGDSARGWACVRGGVEPISVHFYVGGPAGIGQFAGAVQADLPSEPGVAAACESTGTRYRFSFPVDRGTHVGKPIYAYGIHPSGVDNRLLWGSELTVPPLKARSARIPRTGYSSALVLVARQSEDVSAQLTELRALQSMLPAAFAYATHGRAAMAFPLEPQVLRVPDGTVQLDVAGLTRSFYLTHADEFDFLSYVPTWTIPGNTMYHRTIQNKIHGTGFGIYDISLSYGSRRLLGLNVLPGNFAKAPHAERERILRANGFLHETGHQWCCYVEKNFDDRKRGNGRLGLIELGIHWYRGLHYTEDTPMGAGVWEPNGDGTWRRVVQSFRMARYHPFLMHFMGLLPHSERQARWTIFDAGGGAAQGATPSQPWNPDRGVPYAQVSVDDIVAVVGQRWEEF